MRRVGQVHWRALAQLTRSSVHLSLVALRQEAAATPVPETSCSHARAPGLRCLIDSNRTSVKDFFRDGHKAVVYGVNSSEAGIVFTASAPWGDKQPCAGVFRVNTHTTAVRWYIPSQHTSRRTRAT